MSIYCATEPYIFMQFVVYRCRFGYSSMMCMRAVLLLAQLLSPQMHADSMLEPGGHRKIRK